MPEPKLKLWAHLEMWDYEPPYLLFAVAETRERAVELLAEHMIKPPHPNSLTEVVQDEERVFSYTEL